MEEWKTDRIENLIDALIDYRGKTPQKDNQGIPLITAKIVKNGRIDTPEEFLAHDDYDSWMRRGYPQIGDVVLTTEAPLGEVAQISYLPVALAQRIVTLRGKEGILDSTYLKYFLQSEIGQKRLSARETGTTVTGIKQSELRKVEITYPSFPTQRKIASILKSIDDKIELNNHINHNLEMQAQALFKSWFVDFEPFRGGKLVDSELGLIPIGWDAKPLSSICHIEKKTINPQKYPTCLFTHYSIPAYDNSELPELQKGSDILSNKYIISDYTILFSKLNPRIKRIWNVYQSESNPICSTEFVVYKPMDIDTYPFLYSFITGDDFYNNIMSKVNGATGSHQRFHPEETLDILVPYHIDCYRLYSQLVLPIIQQIDENKRENHYFSSLRDSLLPKLMSGELKINDLTC